VSNLREELARRLSTIWQKEMQDEPDADVHWNAIADECIRQMEWARRECVIPFQPDYDECEIDYSAPLTFAPADWKP